MKREQHGESKTQLYRCWRDMKRRCKDLCRKYYGEKGITVCEDWKNSFLTFKSWAEDNGYEEGLSLDRIDSNLGYYPDNCRWVTLADNTRNCLKDHFSKKTGHFSEESLEKRRLSNRKINGKSVKLFSKQEQSWYFETISDCAKFISKLEGKDWEDVRKNISQVLNNNKRKTYLGCRIQEDAS